MAIIALDSLLHATTQADQLRVLRSPGSALDPRGQADRRCVQSNPGANPGNGRRSHVFPVPWTLENGARLDKLVAQNADVATQSIDSELWYEVTTREGAISRTRTSFVQRWVGAGELVLMLQLAGFQDWRVYGTYDLDPLEAHSDRIIIAAEKTKTD